MWIKEVNFPVEVIEALQKGRLIIFAGAGVSAGPPSNLPTFKNLAEKIAKESGFEIERPFDRFLGKLKKNGVKTHHIAQEILSNPNSKPTELHKYLVKLFSKSEDVRIVTTNFDRHFSTVVNKEFGNGVKIYYAPALPLGNKFNGLVYLHGCIDQNPEELILTDSDFGLAYLIEGWATRFLKALFTEYVVLFIGYSHNDLIMQYLARGLPPEKSRYALTHMGNGEHWEFLGITPIPYPLKEDSSNKHEPLVEAIKEWSKRIKWGLLEHKRRIRKIVKSPPPLEREEADYIENTLKDLTTTRIFLQYARSLEWLEWAEEKGLFKPLFKLNEPVDKISQEIAVWFAENYVLQHPEEALTLVQRHGLTINPVLWQEIAHRLAFSQQPLDTKIFARWVEVLLQSALQHKQQFSFLEYLLLKCQTVKDDDIAILLFEYLTRPYPILKPHFGLDEERQEQQKVDIEVAVSGKDFELRERWERHFKPNLKTFAYKLEPILTNHLQQAHLLLRATGRTNELYDPISVLRPAIEPHEQNHYYKSKLDVLIDAARDIIEYLAINDPAYAQAVITKWAFSDIPLLKRLAIHGIIKIKSRHLTSDEKIKWLLNRDRDWLYAPHVKHEVFRLLKIAYPEASENIRKQLLEKAEYRLDAKNEKTRQYEAYNLLYWLHKVAPDCSFTTKKFRKIQEAYPEFKPHKYPNFEHYFEAQIGSQSPITVEEILSRHPSEIIGWLLSYQGEEFMGPDRLGLLSTVSQTVAQSFDWGWQLVEVLKGKNEWATDLWPSIIRGWENASLEKDQWGKILTFLKNQSQLYQFSHAIADLLLEGIKKTEGGIPFPLLLEAENIAKRLWDTLERSEEEKSHECKDWLTKAINHSGGKLAEFWLYALSKRIKKEKLIGLPEAYKRYFAKVLLGKSYSAQMGRILLSSQLYFLFNADPDWTRKNLLPLFNWSIDKKQAQQAWDGYLKWGKWNEPLLKELLPLYEKSFSELPNSLSHVRDRFCAHLARIAIYSSINPLKHGWLMKFIETVENIDRKSWAFHIHRQLRRLSSEAIKGIWEEWMEEYWSKRILGIPVPLSKDEMEGMVYWALEMPSVFPEVVDKICGSPAPDMKDRSFYQSLLEKKFIQNHPTEVTRLLLHILPHTSEPFYACNQAVEIIKGLKESNVSQDELKLLREHFARLGCHEILRALES